MKVLVVTSQVTFVPRNYDDLIGGLAECPHVGGLLALNNSSGALMGKSCGLIAVGARRLGWTLLKNQLGSSASRRSRRYGAAGKPFWRLSTVNSAEAVSLVRENGFDLIVNARTRYIYKADILAAPSLGCINIHHGLLPEQRGTMCDLWSLYKGAPAGFSIHEMTEKIDAGGIIARTTVSDGSDRDYPAYLLKACNKELEEVKAGLRKISDAGRIETTSNCRTEDVFFHRNPDLRQLRMMVKSGMRL